jgi:hypothetical protein
MIRGEEAEFDHQVGVAVLGWDGDTDRQPGFKKKEGRGQQSIEQARWCL